MAQVRLRHSRKTWQVIVGMLLIINIIISIGLLVLFRIENWGGAPNAPEQRTVQGIGLVVLIPLGALFVSSGLKFAQTGAWSWLIAFLIGTLGLSLWNACFTWHNPAAHLSGAEGWLDWLAKIPVVTVVSVFWGWFIGDMKRVRREGRQ